MLRRVGILVAGAHAEEALLQIMIVRQVARRHFAHDAAVDHDGDAAGNVRRHAEVLLDEQHGDLAFLGEAPQHLREPVDDDRGEAFGRLIHHQQARIGQQRPADRKHLLLAAGELGATVATALGQLREGLVDARDRPAALASSPRQPQMLVDRQRRPDASALRHVADAEIDNVVGRQPQEIDAGGTDSATGRRHQPHDRVAERGLAHAVAADDGEHALIERERYALQRMGVAVVDLQVSHRERRPGGSMHGGLSHDARPDRYAARRGRAESPRACRA